MRPVSFIFNATGSFVGDTRIARTAAVPSVQVDCGSVRLQPDTLNSSEFPPLPKLTSVPYARSTPLEGVDGSGVVEASGAFDLPQAESITKASAAAGRAGNFTAVITDNSSASLGKSSLFKSQQTTTIRMGWRMLVGINQVAKAKS